MTYRALIWFLLAGIMFVFSTGEVWAWKSVHSVNGSGIDIFEYRTLHIAEMCLLITIVFLMRQRVRLRLKKASSKRIAVSGQRYWIHVSTLLILGLLFATIGNLIAMDFVDLTDIMQPQMLLATPLMVISHGIYIRAMLIVADSTNLKLPPRLKVSMIGCSLIIGSLLWFHTIETTSDSISNLLSIAYSSVLVFMAMISIWLFMAWGLGGLIISVGGLSLVASSIIVSMNVHSGINQHFELQQQIWVLYFIGHLLIALLPILALTRRSRECSYRLN